MIRGDGPSSVEKDSNLDPLVRLWYAATLFNHQSTLENPWTALLHLFWLEFCIRPRWVVEGWVACYSCTGRGMQRLKKNFIRVGRRGLGIFSFNLVPRDCVHFGHLINLILGGLNSKSCWVLDLDRPKERGGLCPKINKKFVCESSLSSFAFFIQVRVVRNESTTEWE